MSGLVKICGLSTPETLEAALVAGADMVGFMRFPKSPRYVSLENGRVLSRQAKGRAERVSITVDADDAELEAIVEAIDPDLLQLHGQETPARVADIIRRLRRPVMKVIGVATAADLPPIGSYRAVTERFLLDTKPDPNALLPGGNGRAFDWTLLAALDPRLSFMLSGGLNATNVAEAISVSGTRAVDVSSGVEQAPGEKDPERIVAFIEAARAAFAGKTEERS